MINECFEKPGLCCPISQRWTKRELNLTALQCRVREQCNLGSGILRRNTLTVPDWSTRGIRWCPVRVRRCCCRQLNNDNGIKTLGVFFHAPQYLFCASLVSSFWSSSWSSSWYRTSSAPLCLYSVPRPYQSAPPSCVMSSSHPSVWLINYTKRLSASTSPPELPLLVRLHRQLASWQSRCEEVLD